MTQGLTKATCIAIVVGIPVFGSAYAASSNPETIDSTAILSETEKAEFLAGNNRWYEGIWSYNANCSRKDDTIQIVTGNSMLVFPENGGVALYDNDNYEVVEGHAIANNGEWVVRFVNLNQIQLFYPILAEGEAAGVVPQGFDFTRHPEKWEESNSAFRCDDLPHDVYAIYGDLVSAYRFVSNVAPVCKEDRSTCVEAAFTYADVTRNGELSIAEINRMLRLVYSLGFAVGGTDKEVSDKEYLAGYTAVTSIGSLFGPMLVMNLDYNASGQLSMDEIILDRTPLLKGPGLGSSIVEGGLSSEIDKGLEFVNTLLKKL